MRLLLEGRPGAGKTTVARRVAKRLQKEAVHLRGFFTEEVRASGRRVGFAVESLDGQRGVLAHVDLPGPPRVSRYGVDLQAFERLALPALARAEAGDIVLIDELGKMELASKSFRTAVADLFERDVTLVATVHLARHPFTDALKRCPSVETISVTPKNRDELPGLLVVRILRQST